MGAEDSATVRSCCLVPLTITSASSLAGAASPVSELVLLAALATFIDIVRTHAIPTISRVFMQVLPERRWKSLEQGGRGEADRSNSTLGAVQSGSGVARNA